MHLFTRSRGRGRGRGRGGHPVGPVLQPPGISVKYAFISNRVAQPGFLASVLAPCVAAGVPPRCLVAFHHGETALGYFNASGYPGESLFTPDVVGGPGSAVNPACAFDLALNGGGWAVGPNGGARPLHRQQLQNHGFTYGSYPGLGAANPASGVKIPHTRPAGIDAGQCRTTGLWKYGTKTNATPYPQPVGVARQGLRIEVHDVRTGVASTVQVSDSGTGDLQKPHTRRRFGFFCHIMDLLGRDKHLQDLRNACALAGRVLHVGVHFVRLTPDAEICDAHLPNGDKDAWAAYYLSLAGNGASRATWDQNISRNLFAVILGGPDAYTTDSWHARMADGGARLQRCDESGAGNVTPASRGSHAHVIYITVQHAHISSGSAASPGSQAALDQLHRFHHRCAIGQEELVEETQQTEVNLFNYYQNVVAVVNDMKVFGYACQGKHGCRHNDWSAAEWAYEVLHDANMQTEWSEDEQTAIVAARLAAVVRMPFSAPGVAAASTALPNIPQSM